MYLDKYDPQLYQAFKRGEKINSKVKYPYFSKYFNENFNLSFGSPK